jgi:tRNA threonylcarbamoyladenosine biosynthesis protein TsaB
MRFLLIHTAGGEGSVAIADTSLADAVVAREVLPGRSSSERLVPAVRRLMEAAGLNLKELTAVVVVDGPGSFTGVRVGLSAAKGLSEAGGVPLIAVSRLALLTGGEGRGVLDAGRGEFYLGEYGGGSKVREMLLSGGDLRVVLGGEDVVVCEAKVVEELSGSAVRLVVEPLAEAALPFAVRRAEAGEFDDAAVVDANYLRQTDAEIFSKEAVRDSARKAAAAAAKAVTKEAGTDVKGSA